MTTSDAKLSILDMKLCGVVRSRLANVGSKSERVAYQIVRADGKNFQLYKAGDNPFTNPSLVPFDGHEVEVAGDFDGDLFIVTEIHKITEVPRAR